MTYTKSNNVKFGTRGTENPMMLEDGVYIDFDFTQVALKTVGANDKPDYDTTNLGLLFPQNDTTEIVGGSRQINHFFKKGTLGYPHLHIIQSQNVQHVFKFVWRAYDIGSIVPAFSSVVTSTGYAKTYTSGDLHQIVNFPSIDLSTLAGNSAMFDFKLYRDDNVGAGDVLVKSFDIHIQVDRLGSVGEFLY